MFKALATKKVLLSLILIGGVSFSIGIGTFALLQDTDPSASNEIKSGALNVTVEGGDTAKNQFTLTNSKPGDTASYNYTLQNGGSLSANHLQINATFEQNDTTTTYGTEPGDSDLNNNLSAIDTAKHIEVTKLRYTNGTGSYDITGGISTTNGIITLADVQNSSAIDDLTPPAKEEANSTRFEIEVRIADDDGSFTGSDENIMGDGIDITLHFTLMQESSQDSI